MEDKGGLGSERVWSATDDQDHRFADFQGGFELLIDLVSLTLRRRPRHWTLKLRLDQLAGKCGAKARPSLRNDSPANPKTDIIQRPPWAAM